MCTVALARYDPCRPTRCAGEQVSLKNQWLVSRDWVKTKLLGRDISDV